MRIRPAVKSGESHARLKEYRGFRHVVRNVNTYNFDPAKMRKLVIGLLVMFQLVRAEILGYVFELSDREKRELVENFHRFNRLKHSRK
jgi:hypothetical protein